MGVGDAFAFGDAVRAGIVLILCYNLSLEGFSACRNPVPQITVNIWTVMKCVAHTLAQVTLKLVSINQLILVHEYVNLYAL